ncbi:gamma-glutamylcyclotransferase, partial [candidate division KSB1 bacterium]|nr:gamma-glutamylcyclotransferase [candidate division KSB1 bacterium]
MSTITNHNGITATTDRSRPIGRLFVYGSLNDDHQFRLITGTNLPSQPATLLNYRRVQPRQGFSFAVPWRGDRIEGKILTGVTSALLDKLDEYESLG